MGTGFDFLAVGLMILAFTRKVNLTPNRNEEFLLILFLSGRFSNLEVDGTNVASSIVGHNPVSSDRRFRLISNQATHY